MEISILSFVGPNAIFHSEGLLIYQQIESSVKGGQPVTLSFRGMKSCTYAFLNACIGKLYMTFRDRKFEVKVVEFDHVPLLGKKLDDVIENVKNEKIF